MEGFDQELNKPSGAGNGSEDIGPSSRLPELNESMDPELPTKRKGRYNLRTSLAWDTAFFTSAGVLDAEELSTMITGTDESAKNSLARIEEDITGSTESISSFQSDNLTLDSHEDDLFVDIRASIQRSSKRPPSLMNNSISKTPDTEVLNEAVSSLKKEDLAIQCKNSKMAPKKVSDVQTVRLAKCQPKQNSGKAGSGKTPNQNTSQSQVRQVKSIPKDVPSTSVLRKPINNIAKTVPSSAATVKRGSIGSAHGKPEGRSLKSAIVSSKGSQSPKGHVATGAGRVPPKPAGFSKTSSVGSSTSSRMQLSRLSSDSSSSISSKAQAKSPVVTVKRNPVKTSNIVTRPLGSVNKPPSKAAVKDRQATSKLSAYIKSTKTSTTVSPASSISEWSSVSSRSHNPRTSFDASSCKSMDSDISVQDLKNHAIADGRKSQEVDLPGNNIRNAPAQTGGLQAPMKPSGLRLPSPKIGFFDGVKSNTPKRAPPSQFGLRSSLSKGVAAACSPKQSPNTKLKNSPVPTATTVTDLVNRKPASSKGISLASSKKKSNALADDSPTFSANGKDNTAMRQSFKTADKVQVMDTSMSDRKENVGDIETVTDHQSMGVEVGNSVTLLAGTAPGLGSVNMGCFGDAFVPQDFPATNAVGETCQEGDKVEAANEVIDTVASATEDNLVTLQKEAELHNTDIVKIAPGAETNSSGLDDIGLNMSTVPEVANSVILPADTAPGLNEIGIVKIASVAEPSSSSGLEDFGLKMSTLEVADSVILPADTASGLDDIDIVEIVPVAETNSSGLDDIGLKMSPLPEVANSVILPENAASSLESVSMGGLGHELVSRHHPMNNEVEVEVGLENQVIDTVMSVMEMEDSLVDLKTEIERNNTDVEIVKMTTAAESNISGIERADLKADGVVLISQNQHENMADEIEIGAADQVRDVDLSAINERLVGLEKEIELNNMSAGITDIAAVAESSNSGLEFIGQEESNEALIGQKHLENTAAGNNHRKKDELEVGAQTQVLDAVVSAINEKLVELKKEVEQKDIRIGITDIAPVTESGIRGLECFGQEGGGDAYLEANAVGNNYEKADEVEASSQVIGAVMAAINDELDVLKKEVEQNDLSGVVMDITGIEESSTSILGCLGHNFDKADEVEASSKVIDAVMTAINDELVELKKEVEQNTMSGVVMDIAGIEEGSTSVLECLGREGHGNVLVCQDQLENKANEAVVAANQVMNAVDIAGVEESSTSVLECLGREGDINALVSQDQLENKSNVAEVVAANQVMNAVMSAIDDKLNDLKREFEQDDMGKEVMDIGTTAESNISGLECVSDTLVSQIDLDSDSYQTSEGSDKENGHVVYQGEGVRGYDRNVNPNDCGSIHEVLSEIQDSVVSFPVKASKSSTYKSPLTVKNVSGNGEHMSLSKESDELAEVFTAFGLLSLEKNESC